MKKKALNIVYVLMSILKLIRTAIFVVVFFLGYEFYKTSIEEEQLKESERIVAIQYPRDDSLYLQIMGSFGDINAVPTAECAVKIADSIAGMNWKYRGFNALENDAVVTYVEESNEWHVQYPAEGLNSSDLYQIDKGDYIQDYRGLVGPQYMINKKSGEIKVYFGGENSSYE